jgi:hypothetical protein
MDALRHAEVVVKLYIDTSKVQFSVTLNPAAKNDQNGKQKFTRDGAPMWQTQVQALDETGGEILMVTVAGVKPEVTTGMFVTPVGLEAVPWNTNGKHGVVYRAVELKPVAVSTAK